MVANAFVWLALIFVGSMFPPDKGSGHFRPAEGITMN
jgi:hypothetical protein